MPWHVMSMLLPIDVIPLLCTLEITTEGGTAWRREGEHVTVIADMETSSVTTLALNIFYNYRHVLLS